MFTHLIVIKPLGFLYGSSGPFLSPDNLVGRAGNNFPPSSATVSGLYAHKYNQDKLLVNQDENEDNPKKIKIDEEKLRNLIIAGPFWAQTNDIQNFYVPAPLNYLTEFNDSVNSNSVAKEGKIKHKLTWNQNEKQWKPFVTGKFDSESWLPINQWLNPETVKGNPWQYKPHLHPTLEANQRKVDQKLEKGSLFLENAVQMHPDTCLVYLTNTKIDDGWYRFGGESHLIDLECQAITNPTVKDLLNSPIEDFFALITPAIWGSNRFSYRLPMIKAESNDLQADEYKTAPEWENAQMITERAKPFRYRLGGDKKTKRLSRGRYSVPAGTVYVLEKPLSQSWLQWDESWFPVEGVSLKRWGCGLALPLII